MTTTAAKTTTERPTEYKPFGGSQIIGPNDKFTGGRYGYETVGGIMYEPYDANPSSVLEMHIGRDIVYAKHAPYDGKTFTIIFYTIDTNGKEKEIGRASDPRIPNEEVQNIFLATPNTKRINTFGTDDIQNFYKFAITDKGDAWYSAGGGSDDAITEMTSFSTYVEYKNGKIVPFVY